MASDTLATGAYKMRVDKIYRLPDGGVVGGAGGAKSSLKAIQWMLSGEAGEPPGPDESEPFNLLILRPDGSIWIADNGFPAFRVRDTFAAIGSGCGFAMAAMEMGADPASAVRIAAKYDECTNNRVTTLTVEPTRARKRT